MSFDTGQPAYTSLRSLYSEHTTPLVIWCGSGVSASAGLPTWLGLRDALISTATAKAETFPIAERNELLAKARRAQLQKNLWVAFDELHDCLGEETFRSSIREALAPATDARVNLDLYLSLWKLRPRGFLTLNLDRLAARSFVSLNGDEVVNEFDGDRAGPMIHTLRSSHSYICNLHGNMNDAASWVLTNEALRRLQANPGYATFVRSILATSVVLFVGMTLPDAGSGSYIEALAADGVDLGSHYWATDNKEVAVDAWAEKNAIRIIRYASAGSHVELREMVADLARYRAPELPPAEPVHPESVPPVAALPTATELSQLPLEEARRLLNGKAASILHNESQDAIAEYERFCDLYEPEIHRVWYTSDRPGRNSLLGYTLNHRLDHEGAFGVLYSATNEARDRVAVKVLRSDLRARPEYIQAFRRGVRSMRYLAEAGVAGVVPYRDAAEIPAFVVMEWVEGCNLADAVTGRLLEEWSMFLRAAEQLTRIIAAAHAIPERVLHRDIRPANVMLRNPWSASRDWEVVVLDFDLSWHQGAIGASLIGPSAGSVFQAPEQFLSDRERDRRGLSTRHAAVDSFGLGMTMFFMLRGTTPILGQHLHADWESRVRADSSARKGSGWRSTGQRVARLILSSTRDRQSERWDVAQIHGELLRLGEAGRDPGRTASAELIAEEIAARTDVMLDYRWDEDRVRAIAEKPTGLKVVISGNESAERIELVVERLQRGFDDRRAFSARTYDSLRSAAEVLTSAGWTFVDVSRAPSDPRLQCRIATRSAATQLDRLANAIDRGLHQVRFEQ